MKGVFQNMRIYHPVRGVGGALRENSFAIIDDAGVEIGQGGLEFRVLKKMLPERPLEIEMSMNAHPVASALIDEALGVLSGRGVPYLVARAVRRNQSAMKMFKRCGFEWVRTERYLLGRDL